MFPAKRFRRRSPLDGQVLGVLVRQAERDTVAADLKLTPYRVTLLRAIEAKEIKAGQGQYVGAWRWHGSTVTKWVKQLIHAGWVQPVGKHAELTDAGRAVLPKDGA